MATDADAATAATANDLLADFDQLIDWRAEADAVCADLRAHVRHIGTATRLPASRTHIHLNVTTLEGRQLCVLMAGSGFRIVGAEAHDTIDDNDGGATATEGGQQITYETPYALLGAVSDRYTQSFGDTLCGALQQLAEARTSTKDGAEP